MTSRAQSQCTPTCARYRSPFNPDTPDGVTRPWCAAFPDGIPDKVWSNAVDHREPVEGDHGLRWVPAAEGVQFPTYAMASEQPR